MNIQFLLSSIGIKSLNIDSILEGSVAEVENRITNLKTKLDENEILVKEKRRELDARIKEFNENIEEQEKLYKFGQDNSGDWKQTFQRGWTGIAREAPVTAAWDKNNLFSQLKVYKSKSDTFAKVDYTALQNSPVIDDSKEAFMKKLDAIRIFKEPERELRYLNEVRDIQKQQEELGKIETIDKSAVNKNLRGLQDIYVTKLQQLLNGIGADKPYYTGVKQYVNVGGYETDNREGFLQMPVIMNSKRYNDMKNELFLRHETVDNQPRVRGVYMAQPGVAPANNLTLGEVQTAHGGGQPPDGSEIIRTTGGNFALRVSRDLGNGHSADDFKLTKPVNLGNVESIEKNKFDKIVLEQTVYNGGNTPPDVNRSTDRVVRSIYRGNGTIVEATDARACLAGLIPFDESIFKNLLQEDQNGLIQTNTSDGVTDRPIVWRGKSYSLRGGAPNSLLGEKNRLKTGQDAGEDKQVFPKIDNRLKDPSDTNMISSLELEKLCKDFQTKLSECNDDGAGNKGWQGLGWLFTPSQDGQTAGGCFNPNYEVNVKKLHLRENQGHVLPKFVVKTADGQNDGGLKLQNVVERWPLAGLPAAHAVAADAIHTTGATTRNRFDQSQAAYTGNGGANFLYTRDNPAADWNVANGGGNADIKDIATITRRRCVLFLFHFLEKAFGAEWYTSNPQGRGLYKVLINKEEVYKKLSDWDQVEKWWSYTSTAEACIGPGPDGVVCSYNGEKRNVVAWVAGNELYPEKLTPQECLLCFARHLFIGKQTDVEFIAAAPTKPRHAHEDEVKVWDIIEEFLPKFYRCALVIKHKEVIKDFYTNLDEHTSMDSDTLKRAKESAKQIRAETYEYETKKLSVYPQDIYRDLLVKMYDTEEKQENKRYCCCKKRWSPYVGGDRFEITPCNVCSVAHYFYDMPEAIASYDFRGYYDDTCGEIQDGQADAGDFIGRNLPNQIADINGAAKNGMNPAADHNWEVNPIKNLSYILCNWQLFHSEYNEYLTGHLPVAPRMRTSDANTLAGQLDHAGVAPRPPIQQRAAHQYRPYVVDTSSNIIKGLPANENGIWKKNDPGDADTYDDPEYSRNRVDKRKKKLNAKVEEANALPVITFDSRNGSAVYGSYVVNDTYSKKEAEFKLSWPKQYSTRINGPAPPQYLFQVKDPEEPSTDITSGRTLYSEKHNTKNAPPYPIKHLNYKVHFRNTKYFDMKRMHGQSKSILMNYFSGWELKKEIYDTEKQSTAEQTAQREATEATAATKAAAATDEVVTQSNNKSDVSPSNVPGTSSSGDKLVPGKSSSGDKRVLDDKSVLGGVPDKIHGKSKSGYKGNGQKIDQNKQIKDIMPFTEKKVQAPKVSSLSDAKSNLVVEFSDYKTLEGEYDRVKQEIERRDTLLKEMVSSYREKQLIDTSDRTEQRIIHQSEIERRSRFRSEIKELERKQKDQLDFLRITMSKMKEKEELYRKQEEEMNILRENQRRSQIEGEMNRLVLQQKGDESQHMRNLHIKKLRKKQGEYLGLSDDTLSAGYNALRGTRHEYMDSQGSLPPIFSETKKPEKKTKTRTQSKKRANQKNKQKKKKTPKKSTV